MLIFSTKGFVIFFKDTITLMGLSHTLDDDGSDTDLFYVIYEHTRMVKLKIFELIWIVKDFVTRCVEESYLMKKIRRKINYIRKNTVYSRWVVFCFVL